MSPNRPAFPWRTRLTATVLVAALVFTPGCGRLRRRIFGGSSPTRAGTLAVAPPRGPVGTPFTLTAGGLRPGEPMTFEVDPPNRKRFVGPSHTAGPDGRVTSIYTPQAGDPPGSYQVKAVGSRGTRATANLVVTAGTGPSSPGG